MQVSLKQFLRTGVLGSIYIGIAEQQVLALLGNPDAIGGFSRKYRSPSVLKYGCVEFHIARNVERSCKLIYIEREENREDFTFPASWITIDWDFLPDFYRVDVENYLINNGLIYENAKTEISQWIIMPSNVRITFDEEQLWSIASLGFD